MLRAKADGDVIFQVYLHLQTSLNPISHSIDEMSAKTNNNKGFTIHAVDGNERVHKTSLQPIRLLTNCLLF